MTNTFKRSISALMISAVLATGFVPRQSQAAVGGVMSIFGGAGIPVMVVGGVTTAGGLALYGTALAVKAGGSDSDGWRAFGIGILSIGVTLVGLVVLDSKDQQGAVFGTLDDKTAQAMNISSNELAAYNSELDEVNAIRDEVTARLLESKNPTVQESQAAWSELKGSISPESFSVVEKISLNMVSQIQAKATQ